MNFQQGEILLFDKELDWTSFDLVKKVRNKLTRFTGEKKLKVGHAGTLDPKATGLMILCTGKATKQIESLQAEEKEYVASIKLGATTPSYDLETEEDAVYPTGHITPEIVQEVFQKFTGEQLQVPPIFSAVKIDGKRAYEHARKGNDVKLNAKLITVHEMELLEFSPNQMVVRIRCSKGTYIRALARDMGEALHSGAYLTGLRRTKIGAFDVNDALTIEFFLNNLEQIVTN